MSIALERSNKMGGRGGTELIRGISCMSIYDSQEVAGVSPEGPKFGGRKQAAVGNGLAVAAEMEESTTCSSSIGRNSDCSRGLSGSDGEDSGEAEVQSRYKGPLDTMDALEESLPIKQGISKFYRGKSKSFTSLADVSSSAKDLTKTENFYTRKRKNLLAFSSNRDRHQNNPMGNTSGGISKRPANCGRITTSTTASSSDSNSSSVEDHEPVLLLPPLPPYRKVSPILGASQPQQKWSLSFRSFSLADLQGATISTSSLCPMEKHKRFY